MNAVPKTPFERWVHILKFSAHYCGTRKLPEWAEKEEGISMAVRELERINADKQYRQLLEAREKSELVHRTLLVEARQEGRDGMAAELVQKMLAKGKTPEEISELTEIPLHAVLRLTGENEKSLLPSKVSESSRPFRPTKSPRARKK